MFHDIDNYGFNVSMTSPSIQFQILNHGIYDKKYGEMSRFRFWSDKWGAMNNADKQRLSDDADERFQRNVNQVNLFTLIRIDQICSTCVGVLLVFYIYDVCYPDMELEIIPYQGNFYLLLHKCGNERLLSQYNRLNLPNHMSAHAEYVL